MAHVFIVEKFSLDSKSKVRVDIGVDNQKMTIVITKEKIGYTIPKVLDLLLLEKTKRSQLFVELLDDFYNNLSIDLPADLSCLTDQY